MTENSRPLALRLLDMLHKHQEAVLSIDVLADYIKPAVPMCSMSERQKIVWCWAQGNGLETQHHNIITQEAEARLISATFEAIVEVFALWSYDDGSIELSVGDEVDLLRCILEQLKDKGDTLDISTH